MTTFRITFAAASLLALGAWTDPASLDIIDAHERADAPQDSQMASDLPDTGAVQWARAALAAQEPTDETVAQMFSSFLGTWEIDGRARRPGQDWSDEEVEMTCERDTPLQMTCVTTRSDGSAYTNGFVYADGQLTITYLVGTEMERSSPTTLQGFGYQNAQNWWVDSIEELPGPGGQTYQVRVFQAMMGSDVGMSLVAVKPQGTDTPAFLTSMATRRAK